MKCGKNTQTHIRIHTYRHVFALARLGRSHFVRSLAAVSAGVFFGYSFELLQSRHRGRMKVLRGLIWLLLERSRFKLKHLLCWGVLEQDSESYLLSNQRAPWTKSWQNNRFFSIGHDTARRQCKLSPNTHPRASVFLIWRHALTSIPVCELIR